MKRILLIFLFLNIEAKNSVITRCGLQVSSFEINALKDLYVSNYYVAKNYVVTSLLLAIELLAFEHICYRDKYHIGYRGFLPNIKIGTTFKKRHAFSGLAGATKTGVEYSYCCKKDGVFFISLAFNFLFYISAPNTNRENVAKVLKNCVIVSVGYMWKTKQKESGSNSYSFTPKRCP